MEDRERRDATTLKGSIENVKAFETRSLVLPALLFGLLPGLLGLFAGLEDLGVVKDGLLNPKC